MLAVRMCQNIKLLRVGVTPERNAYFDELLKKFKDVPFSNIVNYDLANLTDDPGKRKFIEKGEG